MQSANDFSLSICNAITFESLGPESLFLVYADTFSSYLDRVCISRSSGQDQGHRSKKASMCMTLQVIWLQLDGHLVSIIITTTNSGQYTVCITSKYY